MTEHDRGCYQGILEATGTTEGTNEGTTRHVHYLPCELHAVCKARNASRGKPILLHTQADKRSQGSYISMTLALGGFTRVESTS